MIEHLVLDIRNRAASDQIYSNTPSRLWAGLWRVRRWRLSVVGCFWCEVVRLCDALLSHGDSGEDFSCAPVGDERCHVRGVNERIEFHQLNSHQVCLSAREVR